MIVYMFRAENTVYVTEGSCYEEAVIRFYNATEGTHRRMFTNNPDVRACPKNIASTAESREFL